MQGKETSPVVRFMHASLLRQELCDSDENGSHRPKQRLQAPEAEARTLIRRTCTHIAQLSQRGFVLHHHVTAVLLSINCIKYGLAASLTRGIL